MLNDTNGLQTYTVDDIANYLRISPRTVYTHVRSGVIKGMKIGNKWRFSETQIRDYIRKLERKVVKSDDEQN